MTVLRQLGRIVKYGSVFTGGAITVGLLHNNDWDLSSFGVVRSGRALYTISQCVVDYKISLRNLDPTSTEYKEKISKIHTRSAERLRDLCCKNGGCYIKVGQHIGALEYLLPIEYVKILSVLHSQAPSSPIEDLYKVMEDDLGKPVSEIFSEFDPEPLGAASLAQVHKAKLKQDGRVVAVKVQHRRVRQHSAVDMTSMELLVHIVAWLFPDFKFMWLAEETRKNLPLELDFCHEGKNCEQVQKLFKHFSFLKVPDIYWELTTPRVLTMEYCEGGQVNDTDYMKKHNIPVYEVAQKLGKLYSEMIFVQGYIHCDPHPGNILVNKHKGHVEVVLLDHGLYATLTDHFRLNYCHLWLSIINANLKGIEYYSKQMNCGDLYPLFACVITARSWDSVTQGVGNKEFSANEDDEIKDNAAQYLPQISDILNRVPREMLLILKANDLLRGLETNWNMRSNATSFLTMSKCCLTALANHDRAHCRRWVDRVRITLSERVAHCMIDAYEIYMWFTSLCANLYYRLMLS